MKPILILIGVVLASCLFAIPAYCTTTTFGDYTLKGPDGSDNYTMTDKDGNTISKDMKWPKDKSGNPDSQGKLTGTLEKDFLSHTKGSKIELYNYDYVTGDPKNTRPFTWREGDTTVGSNCWDTPVRVTSDKQASLNLNIDVNGTMYAMTSPFNTYDGTWTLSLNNNPIATFTGSETSSTITGSLVSGGAFTNLTEPTFDAMVNWTTGTELTNPAGNIFSGSGFITGFTETEAVPEPATICAILGAVYGIFRRKSRSRQSS